MTEKGQGMTRGDGAEGRGVDARAGKCLLLLGNVDRQRRCMIWPQSGIHSCVNKPSQCCLNLVLCRVNAQVDKGREKMREKSWYPGSRVRVRKQLRRE